MDRQYDVLIARKNDLKIERRSIVLQLRHRKQHASQRMKDLRLLRSSMRKRLIEIERMTRDSDVRTLQDQKDAIDREILEIDRILLTLQRLP